MIRILQHKLFWLTVLVSLAIAICCSPLAQTFEHAVLVDYFRHTHWGAALFIAAHVVSTMLGLPGTLLVVIGGSVFGLLWGTVWSVVGATLGAVAAFYVARYLLRDWIEARFAKSPLLQRLNCTLHHSSMTCVLAARLAPISPFSVVNFLFGLTQISLRPYVLGTLIGIVPGTLLYTWLGLAGKAALTGGSIAPLIGILAALAGLSAIPAILASGRQ
ncbi:MAG: TVP38/TMEM64 family protein [Elainellaceae cyanobacterium]